MVGLPQRQWKVPEEVWARVERVWREDRLTTSQLATRFGISQAKIHKRLHEKFGSSAHPILKGYDPNG